MNKRVKFISIILLSILLMQAFAFPASASFEYVDSFIPVYSAVIGLPGSPVTVSGDSSFNVKGADGKDVPVSFGMSFVSDFTKISEPYPIVSQSFTEDKCEFTLIHYADFCQDGKNICVFTRLEAVNSSDKEVDFPTVSDSAVPFDKDSVPETVPAKGKACVDYYTFCTPEAQSAKIDGTFDSHLAEMTSRWDTYVNEGFHFTEFPDEKVKAELYRSIIDAAISPSTIGNICYDSAVKLMQSKDYSVPAAAKSAADKVISSMTELSGNTTLILSGGIPIFEDNLEALITLKSYAYICRQKGDTKAEKSVSDKYSLLLSSVAKTLENTCSDFEYDWEVATIDGSADKLLFSLNGTDSESAKALCRWFVCSSLFDGENSLYLNDEAENAFRYTNDIFSADAIIPSVISESEDGTLCIGRGCPVSYLTDKSKISFENFTLSDSEKVNADIECENGVITVSVDCKKPIAFSVYCPVFCGNVEYSSCGFDNDTGIVTAPAGTSEVIIRLAGTPEDIIEEYSANAALETAIFHGATADRTYCTSVSRNSFDRAYESAISARVGTNESKTAAAAELEDAAASLSKTVAVYSFDTASGDKVGSITSDMIMQKFYIPSDGTLDRVSVSGEYADGTFAAVYALRRDGYATGQTIGEAEGKRSDNGFEFDFDCEILGGAEYVLCVSNETSEITLSVFYSENDKSSDLYITESGSDMIYRASALDANITVTQADRWTLDTFYTKCDSSDVSNYTKESINTFNNAMADAKKILCTPSVTEAECTEVYDRLMEAFGALETYASDNTRVDFPILLPILIGACVAVLINAAVTIIVKNVKRSKKNKEEEKAD